MTTKEFELQPINNRKSFYWKARVFDDWIKAILTSYTTIVATYEHATNKMQIFWRYSKTTATHINAFLKYYWFDTMTKKEMETFIN